MAINPPGERRRPYAAAANVVGVLRRVRQRNLPDMIDGDFLRVAGVPEIVFGRVLDALRFLQLVQADNSRTDLLRSISAAPEAEYRELLESAVREAYREDFARVDPGQDTQAQIIDAFAPYQPRSQTARMVMLWLGLCREAGIPVLEAPRERQMQSPLARRSQRSPRTSTGQRTDPVTIHDLRGRPTIPQVGGLAGVSEEDLLRLDETTFNLVWAALGTAFYKARRAIPKPAAPAAAAEDANDVRPETRDGAPM